MIKKLFSTSFNEDVHEALSHLNKAKNLIRCYAGTPDGDIALDVWQDYLMSQISEIDNIAFNLRNLEETYAEIVKDFDGDENGIEE